MIDSIGHVNRWKNGADEGWSLSSIGYDLEIWESFKLQTYSNGGIIILWIVKSFFFFAFSFAVQVSNFS